MHIIHVYNLLKEIDINKFSLMNELNMILFNDETGYNIVY